MSSPEPDAKTARSKRRRFQFGLAGLLALQAALSITLGIWKGLGPVAFLGLVILGTAMTVIVAGTVWIASDMRRTPTLLRNVGQRTPRPLVVGLVLIGVLLLVFLVLRACGALG